MNTTDLLNMNITDQSNSTIYFWPIVSGEDKLPQTGWNSQILSHSDEFTILNDALQLRRQNDLSKSNYNIIEPHR